MIEQKVCKIKIVKTNKLLLIIIISIKNVRIMGEFCILWTFCTAIIRLDFLTNYFLSYFHLINKTK